MSGFRNSSRLASRGGWCQWNVGFCREVRGKGEGERGLVGVVRAGEGGVERERERVAGN